MFRRNAGSTGGVGVSASDRECPSNFGRGPFRSIGIERGIDATPNDFRNGYSHSSCSPPNLLVLLRIELYL